MADREKRKARRKLKHENSELYEKMQPIYAMGNRFSFPLQFLLAFFVNFIIETVSRHSPILAVNYLIKTPLVFLYNTFLIFLTYIIVYFFKRRIFARVMISLFWLVLGVANGVLLLKRVTPFNAQDLKVAKDGLAVINNYFNFTEIVLLLVILCLLVIGIAILFKKAAKYQGKLRRVFYIIGLAAIIGLFSITTTRAIDKRVISTYFGNIAFAYEDYGLPYCFFTSLVNTGIKEPDGYSKKAIDDITNNGNLVKNVKVTGKGKQKPNIVVVQLESLFDIDDVEWLQTSMDPLPNLHKLAKNYSNGYLKVPTVGAGTVNTEFEVLTGMNLRYFGPGEYPYKTILKKETAESAASVLNRMGYKSEAIHNNTGNFYSRSTVFDNLGFDSFTSKELMNVLSTTPMGWAKDSILPGEITKAMDQTSEKDFVFTISVQSHGDYPDKPTLDNPRIKVAGAATEEENYKWEYYVNQIYEVDQFVGELINDIKKRNEPTVVVFYGDHLPTMGLEAKDLKSRYTFNTNYLIWDNMGLKQEDKNIASYQLMSEVFKKIGYNAGTFFKYHQERQKTKNYLPDLELLQYDVLYGKKYAYDKFDPLPTPHMVMGLDNVTLSTATPSKDDENTIINGAYFTKYSKVYVNGKRQETTFLNDTLLMLPKYKVKDGDKITVAQMGSSNTFFRVSSTYNYHKGGLYIIKDTEMKQGVSWSKQPNAKALQ
ncbi:MAG: LTA synthase family protein [Lachnospiraceae bacterium]|jgi:phosphoglycerol transferase MdoB-like AlkP superfamily enzyme|nr:LTA synthase family protein [Lachnospiraceae bacterium]